MAAQRASALEDAIANLTRLIASTDDAQAAAELVAERRAMRTELEAMRRPGNVVRMSGARGGGR
jgi:hypothetical protein